MSISTPKKTTAVTVRNLSVEVHRALKQQAKAHRVSAEAEMRTILEDAVLPKTRLKLGDALAEFGRKYGEWPMERDNTPIEAAEFE